MPTVSSVTLAPARPTGADSLANSASMASPAQAVSTGGSPADAFLEAAPRELAARRATSQGAASAPSTEATQRAVDASDIPQINDYGMWFSLSRFPASRSQADVLRDMTSYEDLSDEELIDQFSFTRGPEAVSSFTTGLRETGQEKSEDADDGVRSPKLLKTFRSIADAADKDFDPSRWKSIEVAEQGIQEDGGTEFRFLMARQADDSWVVLSYQNYPF